MGEKKRHNARFFSPKDLYTFCSTEDNSKPQTFFSMDNFPAKRLSFFGAHFSSLKTFPEREILFAELR